MTPPIGRQPNSDDELRDHLDRIRALEAATADDPDPDHDWAPTFILSQTFASSNIPVATDYLPTWSSDVIFRTNDGGFSLESGPAPTSPFAGTYFTFDYGSDAHNISVVSPGLYLFNVQFQIDGMDDGTMISPGVNFMMMTINPVVSGGFLFGGYFAFSQFPTLEATSQLYWTLSGTPDLSSTRAVGMTGVFPCTGATTIKIGNVRHDGKEGNATLWSAGIQIYRLGDIA